MYTEGLNEKIQMSKKSFSAGDIVTVDPDRIYGTTRKKADLYKNLTDQSSSEAIRKNEFAVVIGLVSNFQTLKCKSCSRESCSTAH